MILYCVTLQSASGAFQLLKDKVFPLLHQVPTPDLSVEMLTALSAIMLAQGQESIWNKTEQGTYICKLEKKRCYKDKESRSSKLIMVCFPMNIINGFYDRACVTLNMIEVWYAYEPGGSSDWSLSRF